jgi:hypothetical protein
MRGEAEVIRQDALPHVQGMPDIAMVEQYIAPADGSFDVFKDYDMWVARRAMGVLYTHYAGHMWQVQSDTKKHLLKISIPILMGVCHWYVINLKIHELTPNLIVRAGGEILERYGLPRGRFELGSFLEARAKYSALVRRTRPIPGGVMKRRHAGA